MVLLLDESCGVVVDVVILQQPALSEGVPSDSGEDVTGIICCTMGV